MTIASAIENARNKIATAYQTVESMGGTLPATQNLENLPTAIESVVTTGPLIDGSATEVDTSVSSIRGSAFANCTSLNTVVLRSNTVVDLSDESIFENTPIASKTGSIYVPDGLVNEYKSNNGSKNPNDFVLSFQDENLSIKNQWQDIAYGNNLFVAIDYTGYFSTSTNGINWNSPSLMMTGVTEQSAIAYGNNIFICITIDGIVLKSINGETWNKVGTGSTLGNNNWSSIVYGNGKFVALGGTGKIATSEDGTTWTTSSLDSSREWIGISYGNNQFVALGKGGYVSESSNGTRWEHTMAVTNLFIDSVVWSALSHNGTNFIALGTNGYISTSNNFSNWNRATQSTNLSANNWCSLINSGKNLFTLGKTGYISYTAPKYNFLSISQLPTQ